MQAKHQTHKIKINTSFKYVYTLFFKRMLNQSQMCWHLRQPPTTQKAEVGESLVAVRPPSLTHTHAHKGDLLGHKVAVIRFSEEPPCG